MYIRPKAIIKNINTILLLKRLKMLIFLSPTFLQKVLIFLLYDYILKKFNDFKKIFIFYSSSPLDVVVSILNTLSGITNI